MWRDSIFYQLFAQSPQLLFELLDTPPANAQDYRFDSVAVKEPTFEIDGVFLPPDTGTPGIVFFCEIQFQKDEQLYERLFGESFLYFYRNRSRFSDWQAVVIYPSRRLEQTQCQPYQDLLNSDRVHRIYLNELGEISSLPLDIALMVLTTIEENQAPDAARSLLARSQQEQAPEARRAIIEMITTIMVYKFTNLSRQEVETMLGITLQQTRVYQEAKEEGREEGRQEGERSLVSLLLTQKLGELPSPLRDRIAQLDLTQLEALAIALLSFESVTDLEHWLDENEQRDRTSSQ